MTKKFLKQNDQKVFITQKGESQNQREEEEEKQRKRKGKKRPV